MAIVRYLSVVRLERSWHIHNTSINFWTSPCTWIAWFMGVVFAFPPLIGLGDYKLDTSKIWLVEKMISLNNILKANFSNNIGKLIIKRSRLLQLFIFSAAHHNGPQVQHLESHITAFLFLWDSFYQLSLLLRPMFSL